MKDVKKRHLKERAAKKIKEEKIKKEVKAIQEIAEKWKSNWKEELIKDEPEINWTQELNSLWDTDWKDDLDEGMTTQMLTGILPSTGNDVLQDIPYGLTGTGDINYGSLLGNTEADPNTLVNPDDEYTALTNMAGMFDAPDPRGVGQSVRTFDIATQQFNGHSNIGGSDGFNAIVPGYKLDSVRYVQLSGAHRNRALDDDPPGGYYPFPNEDSGAVRLHFNGVGSPRFIAMKPVDTTEVDTLRITASRGNLSIRNQATSGWTVDPRPMIYYWAGDHEDYQPTTLKTNFNGKTGLEATLYVSSNVNGPASSGSNRHRGVQQQRHADGWRPIHMKPDGTLDSSVNPYIIDYERPLGDNAVTLPDWARGKSARYMIFQNHSGATTYSAWDLYNVQFQRKNTMKVRSLMKPLSDVESSPFVRVGGKDGGAKERKKRVQDIIRSGLKYTSKQFGDDFPFRTDLK